MRVVGRKKKHMVKRSYIKAFYSEKIVAIREVIVEVGSVEHGAYRNGMKEWVVYICYGQGAACVTTQFCSSDLYEYFTKKIRGIGATDVERFAYKCTVPGGEHTLWHDLT